MMKKFLIFTTIALILTAFVATVVVLGAAELIQTSVPGPEYKVLRIASLFIVACATGYTCGHAALKVIIRRFTTIK